MMEDLHGELPTQIFTDYANPPQTGMLTAEKCVWHIVLGAIYCVSTLIGQLQKL